MNRAPCRPARLFVAATVALALSRSVAAAQSAQGATPAVPLAALLDSPEAPTEGFSLYRWDRFPSVLVFDVVDFATQNRMFSRLAFFVEKKGFRGRLLTNDEIGTMHGWNAHDYGPQGLASFFEAARRTTFPLNPEELQLREIALKEGIIVLARGTYRAGQGALISISRSSSKYERRFLLVHESFHGIFFASAEYRDVCFGLWESLSADERVFFSAFFDLLGYDSADWYLSVNEFQAYLMQQPVRLVAEYFSRTLKRFADREIPPIDPSRLGSLAGTLAAFLAAGYGVEPGGTVLQQSRSREEL